MANCVSAAKQCSPTRCSATTCICCARHVLTYGEHSRLWDTLVEQALVPGDRDAAFHWFTNVVHDGDSPTVAAHKWQLISRDNSELLLMEKIAKLEPSIMSRNAYDCFAAYFKEVQLTLLDTVSNSSHCVESSVATCFLPAMKMAAACVLWCMFSDWLHTSHEAVYFEPSLP